MDKSQEEFQRDILEIIGEQRKDIDRSLKVIKDFIEKQDPKDHKVQAGSDSGGFVCKLKAESYRDVLLPPDVMKIKLAAFQKELRVLMQKYEISALTASLLKKYGPKKPTT